MGAGGGGGVITKCRISLGDRYKMQDIIGGHYKMQDVITKYRVSLNGGGGGGHYKMQDVIGRNYSGTVGIHRKSTAFDTLRP